MRDSEMIEEIERLQAEYAGMTSGATPFDRILESMRLRLLAAAAPVKGQPIAPERLAEIRAKVEVYDRRWSGWPSLRLLLRDLLAAYDWQVRRADEAECVIQDQQQESVRFDAGVEVGVAKAADELFIWADTIGLSSGQRDAVKRGAAIIRNVCGPAQLPPHEATLARLRKAEAALVEIDATQTQPTSESAFEKLARVVAIARRALEDS